MRFAVCVAVVATALAAGAPLEAEECPQITGQWGYGRIYSVVVDGSTAYYTMGGDLVAADVSRPGEPAVLARLNLVPRSTGLALDNGLLCFGCDSGHLCVVSVTDPANPVLTARVPGNLVTAVALSWPYAYCMVLDSGGTLQVFDLSDPGAPHALGTTVIGTQGDAIAVAGGYAYVVNADGTTTAGLYVVDVHDPLHPMLLGKYGTSGDGLDLAVAGGRAYIADGEAGVEEIDVSACQALFANGFDSGRASAWSRRVP